MERGLACWVVGLLVVAAVAAPAAGAGAPTGPFGLAQDEFDPDDVTLSAALDDDGSATWSFKYRMELSSENETQAFEELQADVEQNRSAYVDRFRSRIESTVASAENATGRNMSVANVSVETRLQRGSEFAESYGFVEYTFEWRGFAAVEGERVLAGDALEGFYLNNETSLQFTWADGYAATDVDPPGDASTATAVQWRGPQDFTANQPRVVLEPAQTTTDPGDTTAGTTPGSSGESGVVLPALVGALVAVLVVGAAGWLYLRRDGDGAGGAESADAGSGGGGAGGAAGATEEPDEADETDNDAAADATETAPPAELLSNEERVERFLREQGGRAKQQDVVEAMGWTEAKTSQVVKEMRENDDLESFRIGRENVLKLPDADISEE